MTLSTRVALVTGAAQGIGEGIAVRLAQDGLDVAILDVKGKEEQLEAVAKRISDTGRRSFWLVSDVSSEEAVRQAVVEVVAALGSLDVVCVERALSTTWYILNTFPHQMIANAGIASFGGILQSTCPRIHRMHQRP